LDIEQDGFDKIEKQIALNHKKELLAIDKHAQELVEKQQETERLQWEIAGKKACLNRRQCQNRNCRTTVGTN
jgi:hypothetical protein